MTTESDTPEKTLSLWERLGGMEGADQLIEDFYDRVLADPLLAPFFENTSMDRLRNMQREFFSAALGGPLNYSGLPLAHAHHGRGIKPVHLRRFVGHLLEILEELDLTDEERDAIYDRIHRQANDVLGRPVDFTG
jgi:hemoglobin